MERTDVDFDDIYGPDQGDAGGPGHGPAAVSPDPVAVAEARLRLRAAEDAESSARRAHQAAEDALADAEAAIAVLEYKVQDLETEGAKQWSQAAARAELERARRAFDRAGRETEAAKTQLSRHESDVDHARAHLELVERTPAPPAPATEESVQRFAALPVFVEEYVVPNWVHHLGDNYAGRWCSRWWEHAEAITRLEAVWEAFEVMRLQPPPSLSTWLRDHFDPHMRMLTDLHGVFHRCDVDKHFHEAKKPWAIEEPPVGMFAVNPDAAVQPRPRSSTTTESVNAGSGENGVNGDA